MNRYTLYQVLASLCVAAFIVSAALIILSKNRSIYVRCYDNYIDTLEEQGQGDNVLSSFEAQLNYEHMAEGFSTFFGGDIEFSGYPISKNNVEKLNQLKFYYRLAWIVVVISFIGGIKCFYELSKRRLYKPLLYGGLLSAFFTVIQVFVIFMSKEGTLFGLKNMILKGDYNFFAEGDILIGMLPPDFARILLLAYILIVFILILAMVLVRWFIQYCGRPHRF
ncbi:MAG: hypothetical protein E7258_01685 [Lachnospiraceae bacterium]|nr:hypothetical protein [Lachnospiraceae bacterium]